MRVADMLPAERRKLILQRLRNSGTVTVRDLAAVMKVAQLTARRDLRKLVEEGLAKPISGGFQGTDKVNPSPADIRTQASTRTETAIASAAVSLIPEGGCVYLDTGSLASALASLISGRSDLTVVTNDFDLARMLSEKNTGTVIHTGGQLSGMQSYSAGSIAASAVKTFSFDCAFITPDAWTSSGVTCRSEGLTLLKQSVLERSVKPVLLAQSSRYGKNAPFVVCGLKQFSAVICDQGLGPKAAAAVGKVNPELKLV